MEKITTTTNPTNAQPGDDFTVTNTFSFPTVPDFQQVTITTGSTSTYQANESVSGSISGATATMVQQSNLTASGSTLKLGGLDANFVVGEVITGAQSSAVGTIATVTDLPL